MKKLLLISIMILSTNSIFAQELKQDSETEQYISQGVIEIDDFSSEEIYNNALEWITINYNSASDVIQLKDKDLGKIILKGNFSSSMFGKKGWIHHTLQLEFKDDKFRYTYSDFSYDSPGSREIAFEGKMFSKKKIIKNTEEDIKSSIKDLTLYIQKSKEDNEW
ncbi:DUF4468 domain-containing protein [Salegentibacter mishustinae]|uniref:DUF4468 domain-containing protein n=1 Tax=Salegentibacter mishustinae TaxID=270918 RepID=UPI001CE1C9B3|nr:DUF4468 domain-containing protein [Salegentibacter mishustinae]UBZ05653.1 DUF4468 domain-containing protein [Salegentibacter mishustinae]